MSESRGIIPISTKFLENNYLFALQFREGFLFGRTVHRRFTQWKPWPLIDASGTGIDIPANSFQAELRFRDPRNTANSILLLHDSKNGGFPWFYHGAFGIMPQQVNMYLRFPEGDVIPGKFPNVDPVRPQTGDDLGYINSLKSPYEQPTDYVEIVIPPLLEIGAEYFNKDALRNHQPVLNIDFALYWVQFFRPETHARQISDIALRRYEGAKASFLKVGFGDLAHDLGNDLLRDWAVTPMSLESAAALGGGAR